MVQRADGVTRVSGAERSARCAREEDGCSLYGRSRVAMKVDADVKEAPSVTAAPAATPGTPIASNTDSPVSSLDGLLV